MSNCLPYPSIPLVLHRLGGIALYSDKQQLFRRPARVFETNGSGLKTLGNADGAMITLESGWIFYTHPTIQHIHYTYTHILWTYTHNNNCYQNCDITKLLLLKKSTHHRYMQYMCTSQVSRLLHIYLKLSKREREKKIRLLFLKLLIFLALIFEEKIRRQLFFIDIFLSF